MSMFNDITWRNKDNETECIANSTLVSFFCIKIPTRTLVILRTGSETKWYSTDQDRVAELMMIKFGESGHPVFRATSPFSRGTLKAKEVENYLFTSVPMGDTIETVFSHISVNQLSIYGAVSDLCEEYSICQTSTGRLVAAEQSDPFFAPADLLIMTPTSSIQIPAQENLLQKYRDCHARTVRPVLAGHSDPLFEPASLLMKTPTPSTDDPAQEDPL